MSSITWLQKRYKQLGPEQRKHVDKLLNSYDLGPAESRPSPADADLGAVVPLATHQAALTEIERLRAALEASKVQEPVAILHRYPSRGSLRVECLTEAITEVDEGSWSLFLAPGAELVSMTPALGELCEHDEIYGHFVDWRAMTTLSADDRDFGAFSAGFRAAIGAVEFALEKEALSS